MRRIDDIRVNALPDHAGRVNLAGTWFVYHVGTTRIPPVTPSRTGTESNVTSRPFRRGGAPSSKSGASSPRSAPERLQCAKPHTAPTGRELREWRNPCSDDALRRTNSPRGLAGRVLAHDDLVAIVPHGPRLAEEDMVDMPLGSGIRGHNDAPFAAAGVTRTVAFEAADRHRGSRAGTRSSCCETTRFRCSRARRRAVSASPAAIASRIARCSAKVCGRLAR
ncbi:hypothetical protein SAMN05216215_102343 [Saccharopolyspora shandongensis]|uniref:Uncharacterized protein n=1 Tax=Saccharopolyspora shandongensis TaxID=418495 RepID=A0A1H3ILH9_9PSEU|nr:hypothetical protein SAMN05216215_102343 [Saccharopolyspora shandongensis]